MADLTDDRLAQIIADRKECTAGEGRRMAIELMRRRATDLSEQDKESLRWARVHVIRGLDLYDHSARSALAVLDRLIDGETGRP